MLGTETYIKPGRQSSSGLDCQVLLGLGAQRVDVRHPQLEAVEEVFRQTVPVLRQTLSVLKHGLHAEPTHGVKGGKKELSYPYRET